MRVALLGIGPGWEEGVPWDDARADIWGLGSRITHLESCPRLTAAVEMHCAPIWRHYVHTDHAERLNALGCRVYMRDPDPRVKLGVRYPLETIVRRWRDYFRASSAYMAALAIYMGAKWIGVYGMGHTDNGPERAEQRACLEYWLGVAEGMGVQVHRAPSSWPLLSAPYQYGSPDDHRVHGIDRAPELVDSFAPSVLIGEA